MNQQRFVEIKGRENSRKATSFFIKPYQLFTC